MGEERGQEGSGLDAARGTKKKTGGIGLPQSSIIQEKYETGTAPTGVRGGRRDEKMAKRSGGRPGKREAQIGENWMYTIPRKRSP